MLVSESANQPVSQPVSEWVNQYADSTNLLDIMTLIIKVSKWVGVAKVKKRWCWRRNKAFLIMWWVTEQVSIKSDGDMERCNNKLHNKLHNYNN